MKTTSKIIFILSILLIGYGYWGAFSESGNKVYDEMNGLFPFYMLILGTILFIVFLLLLIIIRKKSKAEK